MSRTASGGKRALRLYPSWSAPNSVQAQRAQHWQGECFVADMHQQSSARLLVL